MVSCVKLECASSSRELDSNADIEGIGFLIAFALSAFLTLFICFISYLLNQDSLSNEVDRLFIKFVVDRGFIKKFTKWVSKVSKIQGVEKWNKALQMAVLSFSDQQVLTGLAILISGYVQLGCRGLAVYHWQIVVDLAFFSSVTHLTTLMCLRTYFQTRNILRLTRLICMGVIAIMLGCALWSIGYLNGEDYTPRIEVTFPAWCLYHPGAMNKYFQELGGTGSFNDEYVLIVLLYLGLSYLSRLFKLFQGAPEPLLAAYYFWGDLTVWKIWRKKVRDKAIRRTFDEIGENTTPEIKTIESRVFNHLRRSRTFWILLYRAMLSFAHVGQAISDLYRSVIWEITWLSVALSWGTIRILEDRTWPNLDLGSTNLDSVLAEVNTWAFAQVISILLLALPFLSFWENAYDLRNKDTPHAANVGQVASPVTPSASTTQTNEHASTPSTIQYSTTANARERQGCELYEYVWFRKTILLTYLLSVAVGADMLWTFPHGGGFDQIFAIVPNTIGYIVWICLDLFIIWVFSFVSLCMHDLEPDEPTLYWKHRWATMSQRKYAIVLNVTVFFFLGASVAYDVALYKRPPIWDYIV